MCYCSGLICQKNSSVRAQDIQKRGFVYTHEEVLFKRVAAVCKAFFILSPVLQLFFALYFETIVKWLNNYSTMQ